ncbi:branched-chain amino acid ABC transporter substrate-binding protein [Gemmatimonas sp.]|uniref:branched-chain amino acid ABC transporter substrate-binding protein n=1 Tax=Gemmatimonas sp. TaxID=1962908 RepID=UPI0022C2685F|nr:branched-chain amino acid ABC transporter substrate-binding protein [Gemmatimonas sp.]MCZ8204028.1 branched-chain amino acid ABC transporter substrate-binding protein [Gemmatimonas sp.]
MSNTAASAAVTPAITPPPVRPRQCSRARQLAAWRCGGPLLLTALAGCRHDERATTSSTVAIGVGAIPGAPNYAQVAQGVELAVARLNETAGGPRFRVRLPDSRASSAVQVAQQLRNDPAVIAVVGHPESGKTLEAIPIYADAEHGGANGVVAVSPTSSSPQLSGISPWFFRVAPSDADAAHFTARWVLDSLRARRAAIVYRNDSYGRDWADTFAAGFVQGGGQVLSRNPYLTSIVEWDAYAALLAAERPEVLLFPGDGADALALLQALRARGVRLPFVGGDGTEGMKAHPDASGAYYVAFFDETRASSAEAQSFVPAYRGRYGRAPDVFAALSYDAAIVIGRTVAAGARTRAALRLALARVGNGAPSVDGVAGRIAFEEDHDIKGRAVVITRIPGVTPRDDEATAPVPATSRATRGRR